MKYISAGPTLFDNVKPNMKISIKKKFLALSCQRKQSKKLRRSSRLLIIILLEMVLVFIHI